ncbi:DNA internalization-related competence protein ComEC/Rec2 [Halobacillus andaensis]|uniref:DNA internalization-related competence protein ComEC/Rec2 n=1 Tax=Halobacillus andaensis TaxID=1176239 RepID=A0A917ET86_HALAA|nr:DNA internalization-related competence protein ComEC/Rec2 [Halobacillus andaensis]
MYLPSNPTSESNEQDVDLTGKIISPITQTDSTIRVLFEHTSSNETSILQYYKREKTNEDVISQLKYGSYCEVNGIYRSPETSRNPGQFNYRNYLAHQGIYSEILLDSPHHLSCQGSSFLNYFYQARHSIIEHVERTIEEEAFIWAAALVFGDSSLMSDEIMKWFRDFNLSHLLAISGLHVGLFIGALSFVLFRSGVTTFEQTRWTLLMIIPLYCFIAGAEPSVLRASFMAIILILLSIVRIKINMTDLISLIALGILFLKPTYLFHLGFQFSFLVTFALLLSIPLFRSQHPLVISAIISLVSQLAILPIQLYHFYEFNPLSLFLNLLLVPYFSFFVIPLTLIIVFLCLILPSIASELSSIFLKAHEFLLRGIMILSSELNIQWVIGQLPIILGVLYFVAFIFMMINWNEDHLQRAFFSGALLVSLLVAFCLLPYVSPFGKVTMLDVGQGDTFVIELPYRRGVIMIDAAGPSLYTNNPSSTADYIIEPFLKSNGLKKIDALIVSHNDQDHSGSVEYLESSFNIEGIYVSPYYDKELKTKRIVKEGDALVFSDYTFYILHPGDDHEDSNENSLVIYTELGGLRWVFTGDISKQIENKLMKTYPELRADVLKISHHGSHTSTAPNWLKHLNPEVALISVGRENSYGHPHAEVIESIEEQGSVIFRTDKHGGVRFLFRDDNGTFSTQLTYNAERN